MSSRIRALHTCTRLCNSIKFSFWVVGFHPSAAGDGDIIEHVTARQKKPLHLLVNNRRVNIASYLVANDDVIEVREKSKQMAVVLDASQSGERDVPEYMEVDHRSMKGRYLRAPKLADVPFPVQMEPNLVVEFYSR